MDWRSKFYEDVKNTQFNSSLNSKQAVSNFFESEFNNLIEPIKEKAKTEIHKEGFVLIDFIINGKRLTLELSRNDNIVEVYTNVIDGTIDKEDCSHRIADIFISTYETKARFSDSPTKECLLGQNFVDELFEKVFSY